MNTMAIPEIRMRPKHQLTLPAHIVRAANISLDDKLQVFYTNGVISLIPKAKPEPTARKFNFRDYEGICEGVWGNTTEEMNQYIRDLRS